MLQCLFVWRIHWQLVLRRGHRKEREKMGHNWKHGDDGCGFGDLTFSRECYALFNGCISFQRWLQRLLQRFTVNPFISHERNLACLNSHGPFNRLGLRSNHHRFHLYLGLKLAPDFLLHTSPAHHPHLLRLQIHSRISSLPRSQASIWRGQKSHRANCPDQLQYDWHLRYEIRTRLQVENRRLQ